MKRIKPIITRLADPILSILGEFHEEFMLGLFIGTMIISMILYRFYGIPRGLIYCFDVALSPYGQFHIISVDIFVGLIPLAYYLLRFEKHNGKRVLGSLLFPIFAFSLHDVSWLMETHFIPQYYLNGMTMIGASLEEYSYHYSKNFINIIPSLAILIKLKYLKINKRFLIALLGMLVFHLINVIFQINVYILNGLALFFMETVDIFPFLMLIKRD